MRDNNINTLRFVGAFLVLFGHAFELCYGPGGGFDPISAFLKGFTGYGAKLPGIGVAMFFVLSGYLVTRSYQVRHGHIVGHYGLILVWGIAITIADNDFIADE